MYDAKILADSISDIGMRLITVQATFPRFILAELNTHRVFSRNSASSRAIPPEKQIQKALDNPFIPETFNERVKGMGVGSQFGESQTKTCRAIWLRARDDAVTAARQLNEIGLDKSRINRLLEPFMWHTAIVSSTEWDNFFALRCPPGDEVDPEFPAQMEFQKVALLMREAMRASTPRHLRWNEWHTPLVSDDEKHNLTPAWIHPDYQNEQWNRIQFWNYVSAGRCARVSYDTHDNWEEPYDSYARARKLESNGHMSPFEHPATPVENSVWIATGNYRGWQQLRNQIPYEFNRIGYLEDRLDWTSV